MALGPIANLPIPQPAAPSRDVGAAQRAFFQAAIGKVEPVAATTPAAHAAAAKPGPAASTATAQTDAPKPTYRPGSLLDISI
jgi:hypothetical protein